MRCRRRRNAAQLSGRGERGEAEPKLQGARCIIEDAAGSGRVPRVATPRARGKLAVLSLDRVDPRDSLLLPSPGQRLDDPRIAGEMAVRLGTGGRCITAARGVEHGQVSGQIGGGPIPSARRDAGGQKQEERAGDHSRHCGIIIVRRPRGKVSPPPAAASPPSPRARPPGSGSCARARLPRRGGWRAGRNPPCRARRYGRRSYTRR